MRAIAAIAILILGGALGYGWHEVSPRVLGSAPFCGPKYPGMLRAIPEDEYFPDEMFPPDARLMTSYVENPDASDDNDALRSIAVPDPWFSDLLAELDEPSLYYLASQGRTAFRVAMFAWPPGHLTVITVVLDENGGEVSSRYQPYYSRDGLTNEYEVSNYRITTDQVDIVQNFVLPEYDTAAKHAIWGRCVEQDDFHGFGLAQNWEPSFWFTADGFFYVVEIADNGRYLLTTSDNPPDDTWVDVVANGLWNISGRGNVEDYEYDE